MGRPSLADGRRPLAARRQRHPHAVHALPDRLRLRRPAVGRRRLARGRGGPPRAPALARRRLVRPRRRRDARAPGRDDRPNAGRPSATASASRAPDPTRDKPAVKPGRSSSVDVGPWPDGSWTSRCRRPVRAAAARARRSVPPADPRSTHGWIARPGCRSASRRASRCRSSSSTGAAPFTGTVRAALHALKYAGERRLADPLGAAAAERWRRVGAGGDLVVPVPVHADRARERGYDQAVLLADVVAARARSPDGPGPRATAPDDRPVRAGSGAPSDERRRGIRPPIADDRGWSDRRARSLGRPRRRRDHDRGDAGRLRATCSWRRAPWACPG